MMLSRNLKRALLDTRWQPPTFLLPWAAGLTTVSFAETGSVPPPPTNNAGDSFSSDKSRTLKTSSSSTLNSRQQALDSMKAPSPASTQTSPLQLSPSLRELLPLLRAQGPHYITAHIYSRPYLLTQGDTVRLPFLMHGVEPGDVLRLNCATTLGSRDYTLKAAAPPPKLKSPTTNTTAVLDPTTGSLASHSRVMPEDQLASGQSSVQAPHFIPHIAKGKQSYLDEGLFVCRAVVMGFESEPLRIKEKTKRRQRRIKKVKSKHRFTILKVKEVRVRGEEEIEGGDLD